MRVVGLKILKNKLSEYVRLATSGETVLITDHDRVVAEIVPPHGARSPFVADALLAQAVRDGLVTPPLLAETTPPKQNPITYPATLELELDDDRADR